MKQILFTGLLMFLMSVTLQAKNYTFDNDKFEAELAISEDISDEVGHILNPFSMGPEVYTEDEGKSQTVAAIIAFVGPFAGYIIAAIASTVIITVTAGIGVVCAPLFWIPIFLPYHRWYLGTGGNGAKIGALYCVTLNWLGFLSFADGIFLLLDDTKSSYIGSPKYLMWAGNVN